MKPLLHKNDSFSTWLYKCILYSKVTLFSTTIGNLKSTFFILMELPHINMHNSLKL